MSIQQNGRPGEDTPKPTKMDAAKPHTPSISDSTTLPALVKAQAGGDSRHNAFGFRHWVGNQLAARTSVAPRSPANTAANCNIPSAPLPYEEFGADFGFADPEEDWYPEQSAINGPISDPVGRLAITYCLEVLGAEDLDDETRIEWADRLGRITHLFGAGGAK